MRLEKYLSLAASLAITMMQGCEAVNLKETAALPTADASEMAAPMEHAQTEIIPDGIVQMWHKMLEHFWPASDANQ